MTPLCGTILSSPRMKEMEKEGERENEEGREGGEKKNKKNTARKVADPVFLVWQTNVKHV